MEQLVIIGTGPAGYTAAIYAARANLAPAVVEGMQPGGQLTATPDVENFPGFPDGISGAELMLHMRRQAEKFGAHFRSETVVKADLISDPKTVELSGGDIIQARCVIIATGASAKYLGIESEQKLLGRGVSGCATCDGAFYRDMHVAVVGGGDTALEEAHFLTRFASKVTLIHRRDQFRGSKIMVERVLAHKKIEVLWNTVVEEVLGVDSHEVTGLKVRNVKTNEIATLPVRGLFVAIGHHPNVEVFKDQLETGAAGYLLTDGVKTKIQGVYAAGDVADPVYRQAVVAAGHGCMAAIEAERYLSGLE
ncbi:MAG: thioredoxin-disulfide reductase [Kiritimatiellales bacterium]